MSETPSRLQKKRVTGLGAGRPAPRGALADPDDQGAQGTARAELMAACWEVARWNERFSAVFTRVLRVMSEAFWEVRSLRR